jgi:hypothetical protein
MTDAEKLQIAGWASDIAAMERALAALDHTHETAKTILREDIRIYRSCIAHLEHRARRQSQPPAHRHERH